MAEKSSPLISLKGVSKSFKDGQLLAIDNLSLDIAPGEFVSIIGPSGCGKTTVLRLIDGLIAPDEGEVLVKGRPPVPSQDMAMVFQSARLLPWRTVAGNIEFVLGLRGLSSRERRSRALALLGAVGLRDFADAYPHELSGGMQQRVGLVRAFALGADYLLMDEPFAALDEITRADMRHLLAELSEPTGAGVVFVTHSLAEAVFLSDRIVVMSPRPGRVVGTVDVPLPHPRVPELEDTAEFFALETEVRALLLAGAGR